MSLTLLKSNATIHPPTKGHPYHALTVSSPTCSIYIAALKPLPDQIYRRTASAHTFVKLTHAPNCNCASYARSTPQVFFDVWQELVVMLRHTASDQAAKAFAPAYELGVGEGLAHASLIASLALGVRVPDVYGGLRGKFGPEGKASGEVEGEEM